MLHDDFMVNNSESIDSEQTGLYDRKLINAVRSGVQGQRP
jgi:hypothetical protein